MSVRDLTILGCSSQQPTRERNHGGYLLRWNNEGFLIDPGENTQRQFIFAEIAPTCVTHILISHFHGDHCLGLGSMLMRLNLDKVSHPIHCYYPASGKKYFDRLRYSTIYHEQIEVIEHPVSDEGLVGETEQFQIEAYRLEHGIDNYGWRISEKPELKFHKEKLKQRGIKGPAVRILKEEGQIEIDGVTTELEEVSYLRQGDTIASVIDTRPCKGALKTAQGARLLLCESTYASDREAMAHKHFHMTAKQAAQLAQEAGAKQLILTHFSARYRDLSPLLEEARAVFKNTELAEDFKRFEFPKN